jgi:hypothetical protein
MGHARRASADDLVVASPLAWPPPDRLYPVESGMGYILKNVAEE